MVSHDFAPQYPAGPTPLVSVNRLAEILDVDRRTVYRLPIPFVVVGARRRYLVADVVAYLNRGRVIAE